MQDKQPKLIKLDETQYCFEDMNGNRSETYFYAQPYKHGFAPVKRTEQNEELLYRDMLGNLSTSCQTIVGTAFFNFAHEYKKFESLPAICFINENFFQAVHLLLLDKIAKQIELKSQKGQYIDIKRIKEQKNRVLEMCNTKRQEGIKIMEKRANQIHKFEQNEQE